MGVDAAADAARVPAVGAPNLIVNDQGGSNPDPNPVPAPNDAIQQLTAVITNLVQVQTNVTKPGFRPSITLRYPTRPVHRNAQAENEGYIEDEYRLTLQGTAYLEDNRKVAHYLQEAIRGHTTAYNHCSDKLQAQLGRQAFMALVSQYWIRIMR